MQVLPDTVLGVTFAAREFDATAAGMPEAAQLTSGPDGLVLRLPVARQIARIRLGSVQQGDQVAVFRFDGRAVSDDPVAVGDHTNNGAVLSVTDAQLILRRRRAGADQALAPGDVADVIVGVSPALPRLSFAIVDDPEGEVALPPETDNTGTPVFPNSAAWGPRLAQALTAQLARFALGRAALPDPLLLDLVLEADTPCLAAVDTFDFGYVLERSGFSDGADKQVLRFTGGRGETRSVSLDLPPDVTVLDATLRLTHAGSASPAAQRRAAAGPGVELISTTQQGVEAAPGRLVATPIPVASATVITGADILLGVIEGPAEITASLWEEADGLPSRLLSESAPEAPISARPAVVSLNFAPGVALPADRVWFSVAARRGRLALGIAEQSAGSIATGDGAKWSILSSAVGQTMIVRLRTPAAEDTDVAEENGLVLSLFGTTLPLSVDARARVAEFADRLNLLPMPRPLQINLDVRADAGGVVTVDPPVLRYCLYSREL